MIGVNITTKNGILLFSHFFIPGFSDVDEDLRAGLMTAVLNAVKETQNNTGISTIDQGKYFVHVIEGEFTYGLFFSHENDLKEREFTYSTIRKFESSFRKKLKEGLSFDNKEFFEFNDFLTKKYNDLIAIDVVGLSRIIEIMEQSFFSDYIILERPNLHQVFTHVSSLPRIHPHANTIATMCKNIIETSLLIGHEISQLQFNLGGKFLVFVNKISKYNIIFIVLEKDREKANREIAKVHNKIEGFL